MISKRSHSNLRASIWQPLTERFGVYQPLALIFSTLGIILSMSALSSLWFWDLNDDPECLRSKIALAGRTTSTMAICSALLRFCIAVQLTTCCMMVASLAFEKNCVLLQDAAAMSIYRYSVNYPYPMVLPVIRGTMVSRNVTGICLLTLLSCLTISSQFISTILLSDTGLQSIAGNSQNVSLAYRSIDDGNGQLGHRLLPSLQQRPTEFPRFAEMTAQYFKISHSATGPGISDTGPTVRAFLPLSAPQRSSLLSYRGNSTVVDAHVLCVSPKVRDLQFDLEDKRLIHGSFTAPFLTDVIQSGELEHMGSFSRSSGNITSPVFVIGNCSLSFNGTTICPASEEYDQQQINNLENTPNTGSQTIKFEDRSFPAKKLLAGETSNRWWLIVRQSYYDAMFQINNATGVASTGYKLEGTEWTTGSVAIRDNLYDTNMMHTVMANITLCYSTFQPAIAMIEIKTTSNVTEPGYSLTADMGYNTTSLRNQLGIETHDHRGGIFPLDNYQKVRQGYSSFWPTFAEWNAAKSSVTQDPIHEIYSSIFSETLDKTKTAALSLQAIFTLLTANGYYEYLDRYNQFGNSTIQSVKQVVIPRSNKGLFVVFGIIVLHFLSVGLVFWLYFCKSSSVKFMDQAWQTVGQLSCGEAKHFMHDTCDLDDRNVGRLPHAIKKWNDLVETSTQGKTVINCLTMGSSNRDNFSRTTCLNEEHIETNNYGDKGGVAAVPNMGLREEALTKQPSSCSVKPPKWKQMYHSEREAVGEIVILAEERSSSTEEI